MCWRRRNVVARKFNRTLIDWWFRTALKGTNVGILDFLTNKIEFWWRIINITSISLNHFLPKSCPFGFGFIYSSYPPRCVCIVVIIMTPFLVSFSIRFFGNPQAKPEEANTHSRNVVFTTIITDGHKCSAVDFCISTWGTHWKRCKSDGTFQFSILAFFPVTLHI